MVQLSYRNRLPQLVGYHRRKADIQRTSAQQKINEKIFRRNNICAPNASRQLGRDRAAAQPRTRGRRRKGLSGYERSRASHHPSSSDPTAGAQTGRAGRRFAPRRARQQLAQGTTSRPAGPRRQLGKAMSPNGDREADRQQEAPTGSLIIRRRGAPRSSRPRAARAETRASPIPLRPFPAGRGQAIGSRWDREISINQGHAPWPADERGLHRRAVERAAAALRTRKSGSTWRNPDTVSEAALRARLDARIARSNLPSAASSAPAALARLEALSLSIATSSTPK